MSKQYILMKNQIEKMRSSFLPQKFDPIGKYSRGNIVRERTRAYILLCHAEVEFFLESWSKLIARKSQLLWQSSGKSSSPLLYLMNYFGKSVGISSLLTLATRGDCSARMLQAVSDVYVCYFKQISDNHGIKESNFFMLFEPIGVPATAYNSTLLPSLNSFGTKRGLQAHSSGPYVNNSLDPEDEYKNVLTLLTDLAQFDIWLGKYLRSIR